MFRAYGAPLPNRCLTAAGVLKFSGDGTEKVEEQLKNIFRGTSPARGHGHRHAGGLHEKLLNRFQEEKIPIMVGTQMVAKGPQL